MYELSQIILWILWTLRPAMAVEANLVDIIRTGFALFADEETLEAMASDPDHCALVAAALADAHAKLDLIIYLRGCEIAGVRSRSRGFEPNRTTTRSRHTPDTCWRSFRRLVHRFDDRERLARLRAERLRLEAEQSPLRLAPSAQSTSPALRTAEDSARLLEVLHRLRRGRWIGASSRRDGGGCAFPRGPPSHLNPSKQNPPHLAATCETAPLCPPATILTAAFTKKFGQPACEKHKKRTQQGTGTEQEHERAGQLLRRKWQLLQVRAFRR